MTPEQLALLLKVANFMQVAMSRRLALEFDADTAEELAELQELIQVVDH